MATPERFFRCIAFSFQMLGYGGNSLRDRAAILAGKNRGAGSKFLKRQTSTNCARTGIRMDKKLAGRAADFLVFRACHEFPNLGSEYSRRDRIETFS